MKTLLVATDLSERSDRAVHRAFELAAAAGARVVVLSVIDEDLPRSISDVMVEKARAMIARTCAAAGGDAVEHDAQVVLGDPLIAIHAIARNEEADLVVLGLHRSRPLRDLFIGTTMERLVRASRRPVLLVRDPADRPYGHVLAGVDLSPASASALRTARRVAPGAALHAFFAFSVPFKGLVDAGDSARALAPYREEAEEELATWLKTADLPEDMPAPEILEGSVNQAFERKMAELKPDLVAVGAHGRASFSPSLLGRFTAELVRDPPTDLLVVRR